MGDPVNPLLAVIAGHRSARPPVTPSYKGVGAAATATKDGTEMVVAWPAGTVAGDVGVMLITAVNINGGTTDIQDWATAGQFTFPFASSNSGSGSPVSFQLLWKRAESNTPAPMTFTSTIRSTARIYTFSDCGDITIGNAPGCALYRNVGATNATIAGSGTTWPALVSEPKYPESAWFSGVITSAASTITTPLTALPGASSPTTLYNSSFFSTSSPAGSQCTKTGAGSAHCVVFSLELPAAPAT